MDSPDPDYLKRIEPDKGVSWLNDPDSSEKSLKSCASQAATDAFIKCLLGELDLGYGIVPLLGAGFSVSAGIPIIWQFHRYLKRCICVALAAEDEANEEEVWDPRTDKWPPFIDRARPEHAGDQWRNWLHRMWCKEVHKAHEGQRAENPIYQEALGAMAEWRTSLSFLSRLSISRGAKGKRGKPVLLAPSQEVIDACLRQVMRANVPTLNHNMLANLSQLLRIDTILTTNFDDLTERAFAATRNPLEVFDVHLGDRLPDFNAVSRARSLIKINGSQNSLRADYSLDAPPPVEDLLTFASYVAGRDLKSEGRLDLFQEKKGKVPTRNHLLLFGVGLTEPRTQEFLRATLALLTDVKLFVVCYNPRDLNAVEEICAKWAADDIISERIVNLPSANESGYCIVLRHTESGLLLLNTYEQIRKGLPVSDAVFPSSSRLSLPRLPPLKTDSSTSSREYFDFLKTFRDRIEAVRDGNGSHLVVATSDKTVFGVCTAAAELFRKYEADNLCLWIEMHDILDAQELFETFQDTVYRRLGQADWTPLYTTESAKARVKRVKGNACEDNNPRVQEIRRIVDSSTAPIMLFIDARETPGANREGWLEEKHPNGWLDQDPREFFELIQQLTGNEKGGRTSERHRITVIVLCREIKSNLSKQLKKITEAKEVLYECTTYNEIDIIEKAICWPAQAPENERQHSMRFLQTLVSFQRPRHLAAVWDGCFRPEEKEATVGPDIDKKRRMWLDDLETLKIIRYKDGGFIWCDTTFRQKIRNCLEIDLAELDEQKLLNMPGAKFNDFSKVSESLTQWDARAHQAKVHLAIANWYLKVFEATGTGRAILEAIDHFMFSADWELRVGDDPDRVNDAIKRINSARHLLREHLFRLQTEGHPRTNNIRLKYIRNYWTTKYQHGESTAVFIKKNKGLDKKEKKSLTRAIAKLQSMTLEVSRAICREIGEDREAYQIHRHLAIRTSRDNIYSDIDVEREVKNMVKNSAPEIGLSMELETSLSDREVFKGQRLHHIIRWYRWSGMLGMLSRSYDQADRAFRNALACLDTERSPERSLGHKYIGPEIEDRELSLSDLTATLGNPEETKEPRKEYEIRLEVLHTIELAASSCIQQASIAERREALGIAKDENGSKRLLMKAEKIAQMGLKLFEDIHSSEVPVDSHDFDLLWCKSRLLVALAMASMHDNGERTKHCPHAMTYLGNAASCLHSAVPERTKADIALIELRRADVRLQEAGAVDFETEEGSNRLQFERWIYQTLSCNSLEEMVDRVNRLRDQFKDDKDFTKLRQPLRAAGAQAHDARRFLKRAVPTLRERRRNVWWTTWYFERTLRSISILSWVSLIEWQPKIPSNIPFFGLEDVMRETDSEADTLLSDSIRMIRVDSFRLANVLLSYASAVAALRVRLAIDENIPGLQRRLNKMRERLEEGESALIRAHCLRQSPDPGELEQADKRYWEKSELSKDQCDMIVRVQEIVKTVLRPDAV